MKPRVIVPIITRLLAGIEETGDGCILWTGCTDPQGYGRINDGEGRSLLVHRVSYSLFVGDLIDGYTIDHLCNVPPCVAPLHLEQVTNRENLQRAARRRQSTNTHCRNGHEYTEENTSWYRGWRRCLTCHREDMRARRALITTT